jgi:hypothetical protein
MSILKPYRDPDPRTNRVHDLRLDLCTPQMNRLRYLTGVELSRIVSSDRCPTYIASHAETDTRPFPYLILTEEGARLTGRLVHERDVLRSMDQEEMDQLQDLKRRLDNLFFTEDQDRESTADDEVIRDTVEIRRGDLINLVRYAMRQAEIDLYNESDQDILDGVSTTIDFSRELGLDND